MNAIEKFRQDKNMSYMDLRRYFNDIGVNKCYLTIWRWCQSVGPGHKYYREMLYSDAVKISKAIRVKIDKLRDEV